jgi:hypothetical protein
MADTALQPLTYLDPAGQATILGYNLEEPSSYTGRCLIAGPLLTIGNDRSLYKDGAPSKYLSESRFRRVAVELSSRRGG